MDYKSFEYMRKTLPNEFNWSILYQLFEEDEIELSETAENYLRTTPWNTNLTVFEEILEAGEDGPIVVTANFDNGGEEYGAEIYVTSNGTDLGATVVSYDETEQSLVWGEWGAAPNSGYSESELEKIGQAVLTALEETDEATIIDAIKNNGSLNLTLKY